MKFDVGADIREVSDERGDNNRVGRVLSAQQWRIVRALLDERSMPADPILREEEVLDNGEYVTVCYELHHVLLPELADMRLVEFDRFEDEVRRGPKFDELRRYLEHIDDGGDE